jgi:hypothetical protein
MNSSVKPARLLANRAVGTSEMDGQVCAGQQMSFVGTSESMEPTGVGRHRSQNPRSEGERAGASESWRDVLVCVWRACREDRAP